MTGNSNEHAIWVDITQTTTLYMCSAELATWMSVWIYRKSVILAQPRLGHLVARH